MALVSPGVQVTVVDQSNYLPAATNSVPYILVATAQDKVSGSGVGIAAGTLKVNANKTYLITSQQDLASTFGVPFFYQTTTGTPINGYELNEYGLLAAYSALGVTNQCYVQRADIDLSALTASLTRPAGNPPSGTYWLDTANTQWGIFQWNQSTRAFTNQAPIVITDTANLVPTTTVPLQTLGSIGNYAVTATNIYNPIYLKRGGATSAQTSSTYLSDLYNTWVQVGSQEWQSSWPTIQGTLAPTSLTPGQVITINGVDITVPASPNNTPAGVATEIFTQSAVLPGIYPAVIGGALNIFADASATSVAPGADITINTIVGNGTTATITFTTAQGSAPFAVGSKITVSGSSLAGLNGDYAVASCNTTTATFASTTSGTGNGGTVSQAGGIAIGGIVSTGGVATLTFATAQSAAPYVVGTKITVSGSTASALNGYYTVVSCTTTTVTYANSATTTATAGGTVAASTGKVIISQATGGTTLGTLGITAGTYNVPAYQASPSYTVPQWNVFNTATAEPTGSVWQKISNVNLGTNLLVKKYNSTLGIFVLQSCPVYSSDAAANYALDPSGGGDLIPAGATYAQVSPNNDNTAGFEIFERYATGPSAFTGNIVAPTFTNNDTFTLAATAVGTAALNSATVTLLGTTVADFVAAVSAADVPYVSATVDSNGALVFTHEQGGDIYLTEGTGTPIADAGFDTSCFGIRDTYTQGAVTGLTCSYWVTSPTFVYTASNSAPEQNPADGTYWYYSDPTQVDIMIQNNGEWNGYQNCILDARGYNLSDTNAAGPIISATPPTTQTNTAESPLALGDLWIDTSDLENYPTIYRWEEVNSQNQWVQISNSDQTTSNGIVFADARWAPNGVTNPITDALPAINTMLTSNYLDIDAPNAELYANGTLLFNTRRSGFNVKTFQVNYFNQQTFPTYNWASGTTYVIGDYVQYNSLNYVCIQNTSSIVPTNTAYWSVQTQANTWLTASGNKEDGSPYMGRQAQRAIIVEALKAGIDSNTTIREEQNQFNLEACPNYPELAPNLVALNNDRGDTGFVIVDTPMRLAPADVVAWSTNNSGLGFTTNDGLLTNSTYAGTFYPSCLTNDLAGNPVVCPPSYMMTRTIIRSDQQSYPWFAPAGTQRGVIDNAYQIGYINGVTGEFNPLQVGQGLRDVLYTHQINPITFIPGVGITNFGNKTLQATTTALDRINVARLVAFLRGRLKEIGNNYLFQPNDAITRNSIAANVTSLMIDLIAKRGIYDYLVVCDSSNNTPARIDRNELWVDVAIEPVKAVEFIYIPLRIENTGAIAGGSGGSAVSAGGSGTAGT